MIIGDGVAFRGEKLVGFHRLLQIREDNKRTWNPSMPCVCGVEVKMKMGQRRGRAAEKTKEKSDLICGRESTYRWKTIGTNRTTDFKSDGYEELR
jgi:hypothetical protein